MLAGWRAHVPAEYRGHYCVNVAQPLDVKIETEHVVGAGKPKQHLIALPAYTAKNKKKTGLKTLKRYKTTKKLNVCNWLGGSDGLTTMNIEPPSFSIGWSIDRSGLFTMSTLGTQTSLDP